MRLGKESLISVNNQIIYWNMLWGPILLVILKVGISIPMYHWRNRYTKHEQLAQLHHSVKCLSAYSNFKLQSVTEASNSYKFLQIQIIPPTLSFHICPTTIQFITPHPQFQKSCWYCRLQVWYQNKTWTDIWCQFCLSVSTDHMPLLLVDIFVKFREEGAVAFNYTLKM